ETCDQPLGAEIVDFLESLNPDNIMLSTQLIETLYSYGRIESPYEEESVRAEIEEIIGGTAGARVSERAYGIVSSQLEDVIGEPYFTAIEDLSDDQRVKLYTIAALGAPAEG